MIEVFIRFAPRSANSDFKINIYMNELDYCEAQREARRRHTATTSEIEEVADGDGRRKEERGENVANVNHNAQNIHNKLYLSQNRSENKYFHFAYLTLKIAFLFASLSRPTGRSIAASSAERSARRAHTRALKQNSSVIILRKIRGRNVLGFSPISRGRRASEREEERERGRENSHH